MSSEEILGPRLSRRLGYQLKHAFLTLEDLHREAMAPTGINVRELSVLLLLDAREPESQQAAAERLQVDRTTMVTFVDLLEGKGHVRRRPDPTDRRRNVVEVTAEGRKALAQARQASDTDQRPHARRRPLRLPLL